MDSKLHSKAIFVSNISPNADEKTVSDFFSFCGKITNLVYAKADEGGEAVVVFDTEAAAKTAHLLTEACIVDRSIQITPYTGQWGSALDACLDEDVVNNEQTSQQLEESMDGDRQVTQITADDIDQKDFQVPDEDRSKISVVASLLAAGYVLGNNAVQKAKEVDEQSNISQRIAESTARAVQSVKEFDERHQISQKASGVWDNIKQSWNENVAAKWNQFDEEHQVMEKANSVVLNSTQAAAAGVAMLKEKAMQYESVQGGVQKVSDWTKAADAKLQPILANTQASMEQLKVSTQQDIAKRTGQPVNLMDARVSPDGELLMDEEEETNTAEGEENEGMSPTNTEIEGKETEGEGTENKDDEGEHTPTSNLQEKQQENLLDI